MFEKYKVVRKIGMKNKSNMYLENFMMKVWSDSNNNAFVLR